MAKLPMASLTDALRRWTGDREMPTVDTEMSYDDALGLRSGGVTITTMAGRVELLVTSVAAEQGGSSHAVDEAFRMVTSAPADAAVLAEEVERLRAQIKRMQTMKGCPGCGRDVAADDWDAHRCEDFDG